MINCQSLLCVLILSDVAWMNCAQYVKNSALRREKRTLIWPEGGSKLLAICGFGIPVDLKPETVIVGMVLKANYRFPTNASEITNPIVTYARKKRALNRWDLYALLSQALEMKGFRGKSCLLRAICEVAHTPVVRNFGLFHELVHTFFT
ncbi:hypothetical protein Zmor_001499 [Zophobas morio]|uniref:Uncharacterized protein n=2 Tax=Zophobas morio TaxID=2755281 RepID=A0AA38IZ70_9CUCU|nr:hypothetical protein Zmor_001499 [Zophobas morio]